MLKLTLLRMAKLHLILPDDPRDLFQIASESAEIQWSQH